MQQAAAAQPGFQLRFCTHKTCKKQGALQVVKFGKDLALPNIDVQSCSCLGGCGTGPNIAVIPLDGTAPLMLRHMGTPKRLADMLREVCLQQVDDALLKATELRLAGNAAAQSGDFKRARLLYTQGIELQPTSGIHMLLSNRSGVRLAAGDAAGALEDANAAAECAPAEFTTAAIRQVEALLALRQHRAAMECLLAARERQPRFATGDDYRRCMASVQAALTQAGAT